MIATVKLPHLSDSEDEATLEEWLVSVGEAVSEGTHVALVEMSKVTVEVECPVNGTVRKLLASPGDLLTVGQPLLEILR